MSRSQEAVAPIAVVKCSRWAHYRRQLARGNFSLEANTDAAPEPGQFFLLHDGQVVMRSEELEPVEQAYRALCREFWELGLVSELPKRRVESAWGLLGQEPAHASAGQVIERDGGEQDRRRLVTLRHRYRYALSKGTARGVKP